MIVLLVSCLLLNRIKELVNSDLEKIKRILLDRLQIDEINMKAYAGFPEAHPLSFSDHVPLP